MIQGVGDKYVVPQWLPFRVAALHRESSTFHRPVSTIDYGPAHSAFREALDDFRNTPSVFLGTELMGVADVIGLKEDARELAEYVLTEEISGRVAQEQARTILGKVNLPHLEEKAAVRAYKVRLAQYPRDAIAWVEQARFYTALGQRRKARRSILAALHLSPSERFVVRAAIRYFIHYEEWDEAFRVATKAYAANPDPLIYGPLLSVASYLEKLPSKSKVVAEAALSSTDPFVFSEALEAFGTLEVLNGSDQRARKFFRKAWIDPTRPVIGHSQWILRDKIPGLALDRKFDFSESREAMSWLRFSFLDFEGALAGSIGWALEESYSRSPYVLGATAACHAEKFDVAIEVARRGLLSNPKDETLLNNLAFAYLRNGNVAKARNCFDSIKHKADRDEEIAPAATFGLLLMAEGEFTRGARYYSMAIDRAVKNGDLRTGLRASLNYIISGLDFGKTVEPSLLRGAMDALPLYQDAGCFGAALAISRRLAAMNLSLSPEVNTVAREFRGVVEVEASKYVAAVQSRFIDVLAKDHRPANRTVVVSPHTPSATEDTRTLPFE